MICPKCWSENPDDAKFCIECASPMEFHCPNCGAITPVTGKFCKECAYDLRKPQETPPIDYDQPQSYTPKHLADKILTNRSAIKGERKLVTVLFADVSDFTKLSEKLDPEQVHQIMDGCFKILLDEIHRYEGTINQFTGDGVMALFGAPVAQEDHARQAGYAALAIQKKLIGYNRELNRKFGVNFQMRIGLNSGPVVVGSIGDDLRMDYTAIGDTTNLAARLESMAKPGTILVSANAHRLTSPYFSFNPLGKQPLKGKQELQECFELIKAEVVETRLEAAAAKGLTRFIGRSSEIESLKGCYAKAKSGAGSIVGIVGEAGVGKSRLLLELTKSLKAEDCTFLEGRCVRYGKTIAYLPFLEILKRYFRIDDEDQDHQMKEKINCRLYDLDERLKKHLPALQDLFSLAVADHKYLQISLVQKKIRIFEAVRDLFLRESQNKPLVLAVEDLHWIDQTSQELLDYLSEWLPSRPMMMVLLYRPEYTHQWGGKSYYHRIGVDQLSMEESKKLVQAILEGGNVVPELSELILRKAGGNPLYVEEITSNMLDHGSIDKINDDYTFSQKASVFQIPDTIHDIIAARIDRLDENLKRILQVASVIGREFAYQILHSIVDTREELKVQLLRLQGLEFISEKSLYPELEYIFKHVLIQEVAYNSLLKKYRTGIHEKIAMAIEILHPDKRDEYCELLAFHYGQSDNKDKCYEYLHRANQKLARLNAVTDAKEYFDRAMQVLDDLPDTDKNQKRRVILLVHNFDLFELLFRYTEYFEHLKRFEKSAAKLNDLALKSAFTIRMAMCQWWFGKFDRAIQGLSEASESCNSSLLSEYFLHPPVCLQWCFAHKGDYQKVLSLKKEAEQQFEKHFHLRYYVYMLTVVSYAHRCLGDWDAAILEGKKALQLAEEYSDDSLISFSAWVLSFVYVFKQDYPHAEKYGQFAVDKAPTPVDKAWTPTALAMVWCRTGRMEQGIEVLSSIAKTYQAVDWAYGAAFATALLGEGYWLAGMFDEARKTLEESIALSSSCGVRYYLSFAYRILGEVASHTQPAESLDYFKKCIDIAKDIKAENELALAYSGCGRYHRRQGNLDQARDYLTRALEIFQRLGTMIEPERIKEELAQF